MDDADEVDRAPDPDGAERPAPADEVDRARGTDRVLGVVGTFVLDTIVGLPGRPEPVEDMGGIAYALSAVSAALPDGWRAWPLARVGADAASSVRAWLDDLGLDRSGLVETAEPNNRVELRYRTAEDRTEHLTGGVGPWPREELAARVARCDALLVNFVSGHELSLDTARHLRSAFRGPIHADLHSLFLGTSEDGTRVPRALPDWRSWVACFDTVQMNEAELDRLRGDVDVESAVRVALGLGPGLVACTRGHRGAVCWWRQPTPIADRPAGRDGDVARRKIPAEPVDDADPTGCGDVWGAVLCCRMLAGDDVVRAGRVATRWATEAARQSGASGLRDRLASQRRTTTPNGGTDS